MHSKMDKAHMFYVEWEKPDTEEYTLYDPLIPSSKLICAVRRQESSSPEGEGEGLKEGGDGYVGASVFWLLI